MKWRGGLGGIVCLAGSNTGFLVSWLGYFSRLLLATVAYATEGEWVDGMGWRGRGEVASGGGGLVVMRYWEDGS